MSRAHKRTDARALASAPGLRLKYKLLVQVSAPHFCAGFVVNVDGKCVEAAPILRWALGKRIDYLLQYFGRKRWQYDVQDLTEETRMPNEPRIEERVLPEKELFEVITELGKLARCVVTTHDVAVIAKAIGHMIAMHRLQSPSYYSEGYNDGYAAAKEEDEP